VEVNRFKIRLLLEHDHGSHQGRNRSSLGIGTQATLDKLQEEAWDRQQWSGTFRRADAVLISWRRLIVK
jgi:hypothetical protein